MLLRVFAAGASRNLKIAVGNDLEHGGCQRGDGEVALLHWKNSLVEIMPTLLVVVGQLN